MRHSCCQDLAERSQRWRQIEMLTGVSIVNNPGLGVLQRLVRHVGAGNRGVNRGGGGGALSSRMSSMDDLGDEMETRSVAASVASHSSHLSGSVLSSRVATRRRPAAPKSRYITINLNIGGKTGNNLCSYLGGHQCVYFDHTGGLTTIQSCTLQLKSQ